VQLEAANVVGGGSIGRALQERRKPFAAVYVAALRVVTKVARRHVLDHALTQRANGVMRCRHLTSAHQEGAPRLNVGNLSVNAATPSSAQRISRQRFSALTQSGLRVGHPFAMQCGETGATQPHFHRPHKREIAATAMRPPLHVPIILQRSRFVERIQTCERRGGHVSSWPKASGLASPNFDSERFSFASTTH
jgi:hypothetical protein